MNFGDLDVNLATGNLVLVSSLQNTVRELSPTSMTVAPALYTTAQR